MTGFNEIWIIILLAAGLFAGFLLNATALFLDAKARKVGNLIRLTEQHRTLWERLYARPELARVLQENPDLDRHPATALEEQFVSLVIIHLSNTYYALSAGLFKRIEGLEKDVRNFFSRPIPHSVWEKMRDLQDEEFARFVDECLEKE